MDNERADMDNERADMDNEREVVWRQGGPGYSSPPRPSTAAQARARLDEGNAGFAEIGRIGGRHVITVGPEAFGLPSAEGGELAQKPFAAMLACADARVPVELIFNQSGNSVFVVRVAGNVPGRECLGSLNYAVANLPTLRLITVLGHTECGAVSAAVDSLLAPRTYLQVIHDPALRAIVDALLAGVHMADLALVEAHGPQARHSPGYRAALIEVSVTANAAITASVLDRAIDCPVTFGVFNLAQRTVGATGPDGWVAGLRDSPADDDQLADLLRNAAAHTVL